jgi:hypothetical protein
VLKWASALLALPLVRMALWALGSSETTKGRPVPVLVVPVGTVGIPILVAPMGSSATAVEPRLPTTKSECQAVLRRFGFKGLKIDSIVQPEDGVGKVYALTSKILQADGEMRRKAVTIVVIFDDDNVQATELEGWVV